MKYEIIGGQLPAVVCKLDRGEKCLLNPVECAGWKKGSLWIPIPVEGC